MSDDPIIFLDLAAQTLSSKFGANLADVIPTNKTAQSLWDKPLCDARFENLFVSLTSDEEIARLKALLNICLTLVGDIPCRKPCTQVKQFLLQNSLCTQNRSTNLPPTSLYMRQI